MAFLDNKKCVSYFQKNREGVWVYSTKDYLFFGDGVALFRTEHDRRLSFYEPPEKNTIYMKQPGKDGAFLESERFNVKTFWDNIINDQGPIHKVRATNLCWQVDEKLFIRKFTSSDKEHTVWIRKDVTDTLGELAIDLKYGYEFELKENEFLRVHQCFSYSTKEPVPLAVFMPWRHNEED